MNFSIIKRTLGWLLLFETVFFLVPLVTAAIYWEKEFFSFLICMGISGAVGGLCLIGKPKNNSIYAKEGFVIVALSWIVLSLFGALPFLFSPNVEISFIDALFETVSGFTTTGASIFQSDVIEALPKAILMWRSFTHWVGGMGVLVFVMAFLPLSGARNLYIMKAESPGPEVSKLVPKVRMTAIILYLIYTILTVTQFVLLICGKMPVFDAINTAFATAGTGGFSIKSDSMGGYNSYLQIVVTVFMFLFSINFNSYYMLAKRRWRDVITAEIRFFLIIVASAIGLITLNLLLTNALNSASQEYGFWGALKHSAFSVATVVSTTGFSTENFDLWPQFSQILLVLLMFMGACAGSTGGGIKVSRVMLLGKSTSAQVGKMLHPKRVKHVLVDGKVIEPEVVRSICGYMVAYVVIFIVSFLLISFDLGNLDYTITQTDKLTTGFTSVVSALNNIGPGLGAVGPAGSFTDFSWWSKIVFIFDMLAGRLEVFPMLLLFSPATWRK